MAAMSLLFVLLSLGLFAVGIGWSATMRRRWLLAPRRNELDAWAAERGSGSATATTWRSLTTSRVLRRRRLANRSQSAERVRPRLAGRPTIGKVLVGPGRVLVIETWAAGRSCLFAAAPSASDG
jgi:hypothetical protein